MHREKTYTAQQRHWTSHFASAFPSVFRFFLEQMDSITIWIIRSIGSLYLITAIAGGEIKVYTPVGLFLFKTERLKG